MTTCSSHCSAIARRNRRLSWIALCAFALTSCSVFAQTSTTEPDVTPSPGSSVPAVLQPSAPVQTDAGYWIVSSRHAKKEIEAGLPFQYQVYRFDGSNPGRESSMEEMLSFLQPSVPVSFMVHGSFLLWESVLNDSAQTNQWLRSAAPCQPMHLIFYTWPSNDGDYLPHLKVNHLGRRSSLNGFYLADLISRISMDHPICLIGHSHGTRLVSAALHSMSGGIVDGRKLACAPLPQRRLRVVLAAAAIDHDWLNPDARYGLALCHVEVILNLRNRTDFPLMFYHFRRPISRRALAVTGVTDRDRNKLGEMSDKVDELDVTDRISYGHLWKHYYRDPSIAAAIRHYVFFDEEQPVSSELPTN